MKLGDARTALCWVRKQLEAQCVCMGDGHPDCVRLREVVGSLATTVERNGTVGEGVMSWADGSYV